MNKFFTIALVPVLLMVTACGDSTGQRAVSGGAIGAGGGAVLGAVTGGSIGGAALVGAGVGAATGALTNKNQIDLDR